MRKAFKVIIIALLITAGSIGSAQAQRRAVRYLANYENEPYHFGFLLGYNSMMYTVKTVENYQNIPHEPNQWPGGTINPEQTQNLYVYNIETQIVPGFTVGIIGSKRLGKYFDLRFIPSLSFGERRLNYDIAIQGKASQQIDTIKIAEKPIFSTFVEFPLQIKYRSKRLNNIGAYILGGVNPKLDLASQKKNQIDIMQDDGTVVSTINNLVTKRFDCALEVGAGFDIYNQWFKMGVEVKMSYGFLDVVKNEAFIYTAPIDKLHNKMFQVSLTFE